MRSIYEMQSECLKLGINKLSPTPEERHLAEQQIARLDRLVSDLKRTSIRLPGDKMTMDEYWDDREDQAALDNQHA